ncbi:hypothetical protein [Dysgonomonas macrotermitis]|uniref:Oxygen tolerance n=1 Tax=Dysgonomonas macrotermitis TaxID=1346286 RepID=A0A1M5HQY6_9BACT|nr:hypothetical protein [Dysgonomonas macrotermitis]SHG18384.1 hypothetical protein SAMN05444362_1179 [Dysgonomonas macrotermitis]
MLKKNTFILTILFCCISLIQIPLQAQKATARVSIDKHEISIGQQATISLQVIAPKGRQIAFPVYPDSLVNGIEVLGMPKPDTTFAHEVMTITQKYVITSFDSALYHIPFIPVIDGKDTIKSNDFGLKVSTPPLSEATNAYLEHLKANPNDSIIFDKLAVNDIKPVQVPDFVWQDYLVYILGALLILLLIAAIIIGIYIYKKKKEKGYYFKPQIIEPPHVIALHALDHVKVEKLWQQGREKEYYTEITDILRKYIEDRYHVNAFEKTSDEILAIANNFMLADSSSDSLRQILKLADLVKFAKYKPFPDENDLSLVNAYLFINQTKLEVPVTEVVNEIPEKVVHDNNEPETPIDWTISDDDMLDEHKNK